MAKIPREVQEFLKGKMAWVATAAPNGMPNTTPKGSIRVIDDEHVVLRICFHGRLVKTSGPIPKSRSRSRT